MEIIYIEGDMLSSDEAFIVQGCNAQGVMGSGLAKQIRARYPEVYQQYRRTYEDQGNYLELGQVIWVSVDKGNREIINAITQEHYGRNPNVTYVSYNAIEAVIRELNDTFADDEGAPVMRVAFPLIGCGLANGDWKIVSQIIEDYSTNFQPVVYLYPGAPV